MKVIIPVAGTGTRLKPHTLTLPKPLLRMGGKAILDYLLRPITELGPEEVVFVVGYKGDMIRDYVRKNYAFESRFIQQDRLLGLGYAIHVALEGLTDSPLMILLGDTIIEGDLGKFVRAGDYTLGLHQVDDPQRFGIAEVVDGSITRVVEKPKRPKGNLALIGLYYLSESGRIRDKLARLVRLGKKTRGEIQLTDALAAMIKDGVQFTPFEVSKWFDCGKKETMLATSRHFLVNAPAPDEIPGSTLLPPVHIGENARIENSVIGPDVSVGAGTRVKNSVISDAIIGNDVRIENLVIEKSIIGNNVVLRGDKKVLNIGDSTQITGC
ncbi:MAG: NTP transferase domain-containing protein [Candidatus Zixiibacteriota bacterium]|nr:MAG: NTP transferase domain-containing protein [candidate division Zixibacteria bacterium]